MTEHERIRRMVAEGKITQAEADRLIEVLDNIDQADDAMRQSRDSMEREAAEVAKTGRPPQTPPEGVPPARPRRPRSPTAAEPADPARPPGSAQDDAGASAAAPGAVAGGAAAGTLDDDWVAEARRAGRSVVEAAGAALESVNRNFGGGRAEQESGAAAGEDTPAAPSRPIAPDGTRWLHVVLAAGDLDVRVDPDLDAPDVRGDTESVTLEPTEDGYRLRSDPQEAGSSWVDGFLRRMRSNDLRVRVPAGFGVDLRLTAGDIDLHDVPYLRGRVTAGDIDARGLKGIDFRTSAGDLSLRLDPDPGEHWLEATAGDVNLSLAPGASVTLDGSVSIGDVSVRGEGLSSSRKGLGARAHGTVGGGEATLTVRVTTGDLDVRSGHA